MNYYLIIPLFLMVTVCSTLQIQSQASNNGLIAHYLFNGDYQDQSRHNNHGQKQGNVRFNEDRFGSLCGAAHFDGRTAYIEVAHSRSLDRPQRELSVSTWFKLDIDATSDLKWLTVVCKSDLRQETANSPHFRMQATKFTLSLNTDFTENLNKDVLFDTWYHYTMVYDGAIVTAYLNGQPHFSFPYNRQLQKNTLPLNIGRDMPGNAEYFAGSLDDLRVYDRALSPREVRIIYNDNSERSSPKPCDAPPPPPPVQPPVVTIMAPARNPTNVKSNQYQLKAKIQHVSAKKDVIFKIADSPSRNFTYNPNTGEFQAKVILKVGYNYFALTGKNTHGRDNQVTTIFYEPPAPLLAPLVTFISPSNSSTKVKNPKQTLFASVQNVNSKKDIQVNFNDKPLAEFQYNTRSKVVTFEVKLESDVNSFQVIAENENGRDAQSTYIILEDTQPASPLPELDATPQDSAQLSQEVQEAVGIITTKEDIEVGYDQISLVLYDHQKLDGDTVSVYLNNQVLVDRQMLQTNILNWLRIDLPKLKKGKTYYIISKAWNVGSIAPNTMTLEFYDQDGMVKRVVLNSEPGKSEALRIIYR